uniref:GOST seven transmembrane domain-containing protein n=1 Tax=Fagus sylvatica TaxID=28930 RepID=A0A2N9H9L3_FAGSY
MICNSSVFVVQVSGSIHDYKNEGLIRQSNAFFFHGGSEGLYASKLHHFSISQDTNKPLKGKSFIRFDTVTFVRTKESASRQNEMQQNTGLVEAIILEEPRWLIGYLPGKMSPLMTFYGFMSLAYLVLGLAWFLRFVQFWRDITQLHYHITAVIAFGMCEMAVWYFEYVNFNSTGRRPMGITLWAVTFSSVKEG